MERAWSRVREQDIAGAFGARGEGQMPMAADARSSSVTRGAMRGSSWWTRVARVLRNAVVAVAVMTLVPVALVVVRGERLAGALASANGNASVRSALADPVRPFRVATDPAITPMQAGAALNDLRYHRVASAGFELIEPATPLTLPWRLRTLQPDMFPTARPGGLYDRLPASQSVLEAAAKGFSPREMQYLRELAEAPVWREFDLVARAPAIDAIGGQFRRPFDAGALPEMRPIPSFRDSKELAYAGVSRAAYYMAIGRPRDAEQALRSIVSFGFATIDNGTSAIEEVIGTVIVGIGRDALQRFYLLEHDPRAIRPELASPSRGGPKSFEAWSVRPMPADEARRRLLVRLGDQAIPRPERFGAVRDLSLLSCTNVRDLMFGERADVRDAISRARGTIARYPSEEALLDLETRLPSVATLGLPRGPFESLVVSAATLPGIVLHNPRLTACARVLGGW